MIKTLKYQFASISDMIEVLASFRGPQDIRDAMRALARESGMTLDRCTVTAELRVVLHPEREG